MTDDDNDYGRHMGAKYVEFHGNDLPTSARDCVTLIAEKIENLRMQNKMKSALTKQAKVKAQKKGKTTTKAANKDPDLKEKEDYLNGKKQYKEEKKGDTPHSVYLAALDQALNHTLTQVEIKREKRGKPR